MRVAITGASGMIGTALRRHLRDRGDDIVAFVRPDTPAHGIRTVAWDPNSRFLDTKALRAQGPLDAVVHLAGAGIGDRRWNDARRREILNSRVAATDLLVAHLVELTPRPYLLSASAIGFYGSRGDETLDERAPSGSGFLAEVCRRWEKSARRYAEVGGVVGLARTGIVLDRSGGALARQLPLFRLGLGGRLGSGDQWLSPISLRDHVRALTYALDHTLSGPVNLVAPEPVRNTDFTRILARQLRRPALLSAPAWALRLALGTQMANELVLSSQRIIPARLNGDGFVFEHGDMHAILNAALDASHASTT